MIIIYSCCTGNFGTSDLTRLGPALRVPTGLDATIRSAAQILAPRTYTRPKGAATSNAGGGRHPFMHVSSNGCAVFGRLLYIFSSRIVCETGSRGHVVCVERGVRAGAYLGAKENVLSSCTLVSFA